MVNVIASGERLPAPNVGTLSALPFQHIRDIDIRERATGQKLFGATVCFICSMSLRVSQSISGGVSGKSCSVCFAVCFAFLLMGGMVGGKLGDDLFRMGFPVSFIGFFGLGWVCFHPTSLSVAHFLRICGIKFDGAFSSARKATSARHKPVNWEMSSRTYSADSVMSYPGGFRFGARDKWSVMWIAVVSHFGRSYARFGKDQAGCFSTLSGLQGSRE